MPRPYPVELRERVVAAYDEGEGTYEGLAERFMVGRATVDRWISRSRGTGPLEASPMGGARHERKVTEEGEKFVRELLDAMPDSTQRELADAYEEQFGVKLHRSTMGRSVERMGFTRKRGH